MKNNLPATKADLEKFITRKELKAEVAKLATKEDLKNTEKAIRAVTRLDLEEFRQEINEKLNLLPTKDEFFTKMDELMGELQTIREEHTVSAHQISDHEDRITVLENTVGIATV